MTDPHFSGDPKTLWQSSPGPDRNMQLLEAFWFVDRNGRRWDAPLDAVVDGASIPRALWSLVGSPYTGDYRRASIVHDVACVEAGGDPQRRLAADKMFFVACRAGGCSVWDATVLYIGVRIGAWLAADEAMQSELLMVKLQPDVADRQIQESFQTTSAIVLRQGETDDPDLVAERTEAALQAAVAARSVLREGFRMAD